jgi:superfamily II DNA helicase RecQ
MPLLDQLIKVASDPAAPRVAFTSSAVQSLLENVFHSPLTYPNRSKPILNDIGMLSLLRLILNDSRASFRPMQLQSLKLIMEGYHDVCVNIPTGGGKSLLWELPCLFNRLIGNGDITIIVAPLRILYHQIAKQCLRLGLDVMVFSSIDPPSVDGSNLRDVLLIAVEHLNSPVLRQRLINWTKGGYRVVSRIYIEEAQSAYLCNTFRPHFQHLFLLNNLGIQLVYLSATIPINDELAFKAMVNPRMLMIRSPIVERPELALIVCQVRDEIEMKRHIIHRIDQFITKNRLDNNNNGSRCILYCPFPATCQTYLQDNRLKNIATIYHGELELEQQVNNFNAWVDGTQYIQS